MVGGVVVASIDANREGKNLQGHWYRNLVTTPPTTATWWEQLIGRTHRRGQASDEVHVDVLMGCRENYDALLTALARAQNIRVAIHAHQDVNQPIGVPVLPLLIENVEVGGG